MDLKIILSHGILTFVWWIAKRNNRGVLFIFCELMIPKHHAINSIDFHWKRVNVSRDCRRKFNQLSIIKIWDVYGLTFHENQSEECFLCWFHFDHFNMIISWSLILFKCVFFGRWVYCIMIHYSSNVD